MLLWYSLLYSTTMHSPLHNRLQRNATLQLRPASPRGHSQPPILLTLQKVSEELWLLIESLFDCCFSVTLYPQYPIEERHQICTLSDPADQYYGDSGSPLMVSVTSKGAGGKEGSRWVAVGITSWTEREEQEDTHLPSRLHVIR